MEQTEMNHPGDRAKALSLFHKQTENRKRTIHPQQNHGMIRLYIQSTKGGGMPMTDTVSVTILTWMCTAANIILIALIVFLVVMWIKKKDRKSQKDKTENN